MLVKIGNSKPHDGGVPIDGPTITTTRFNDDKDAEGNYSSTYIVGSNAADVKDHLFDNPGQVTHLPGNTAVVSIVRSWPDHGMERPSWVSVEAEGRDPAEAEDFERFLSEFWKCARGVPSDLEDTHFTASGPPGTGPEGE